MTAATLNQVADLYATDALIGHRRSTRETAQAMAAGLRSIAANRAGADPTQHKLSHGGYPGVTYRWLARHGYHATPADPEAGPGPLSLIIQRDDETHIAYLGDTLTWDGHHITVTREDEGLAASHADLPA